jgi:hypothetical protein
MSAPTQRPSLLRAVETPKSWGGERWLTSTRPEGPAPVDGGSGTLADLVAAHPEVLGRWGRQLFGDEMPIFAKLIHTSFPPLVHVGFRRAVAREEILDWLEREQASMRALHGALRVAEAAAFDEYQRRYASWATTQALAGWQRDDDATQAALLAPFVAPGLDVAKWLRGVRENRAAFVGAFNEVDLRNERGNLLLTSAGVAHAIFGLSHQTHPRDRTRAALEALFATLAERAAAGASDDELARTIDAAGLPALRAANGAPPKNEAWLPTVVDGREVLAEPQQTSDTTYSLADFYTPFTWTGGRVTFRKGDPTGGLSRDKLASYLADVDVEPTSLDAIRRSPRPVPGGARPGADLLCLVDEPSRWPFFTAYQVELRDRLELGPPPGVFQQIIVTRGRVDLADAAGRVGGEGALSPHVSAFVPAGLQGRYTLTAREPSTLLLFSVPGARGGAPHA